MTFLFGEKFAAIGDDEAEVAGTSLVDSGEINFVENAMTEREPNPAVQVQGGADAGLGARSPARFDAGPAWGITNGVTHRKSSSPISSVPEDAGLRSKFRPMPGNMPRVQSWHRCAGCAGERRLRGQTRGIAELQLTAAQGNLLAPFARILSSIAYGREKDLPPAREILLACKRKPEQHSVWP